MAIGALLLGYVVGRLRQRRTKAGSSRGRSGAGDAGYDGGDAGSHHAWSGGGSD
jgi:hypothetical protein